ncbi:MAG: DM13 domain-containing protein [Acidimicrobiia bacterium]
MVNDLREADAEPTEPVEEPPRAEVSRRVAALLPPAILFVGFGALAITNWSALRSATGSGQALLVIAAIAGGWVGLGILLRRFVANPWMRSGVLSAFALGLVVLLVVPYFRDEKVVEEFPGVASARVANDQEVAASADVPAAEAAPVEPAPAPSSEPVRIASGSLTGLGHSASGTAVLYRQPDGTFVVGLEGIDIQSGPDYFVYVVPGGGRQDPDGGTDLGALRGNQGTQFYAVPAGVDPTGATVLVWCRSFAVPVAHATPA